MISSKIEEPTCIERSVPKMAWLLVASLLTVSICYYCKVDPVISNRYPIAPYIASFGILIFGASSISVAYRLFFGDEIVIELSSSGIIDKRFLMESIPWQKVTDITTFTVRRTNLLGLKVCKDFEEKLKLTRTGRMQMLLNKPFFGPVVWISTSDLRIGFEELKSTVLGFHKAQTDKHVAP